MDEIVTITHLGTVAGTALVTAMVRDSWDTVKAAFLRSIGRTQDPKSLEQDLDQTRQRILDADAADPEVATKAADWIRWIQTYAAQDPACEQSVRDFLTTVEATDRTLLSFGGAGSISITSGRDSFVAGRDQHISRGD